MSKAMNLANEKVKQLVAELRATGMYQKQIDETLKLASKNARKEYVMGRFFDGLSDGEIARESGYSNSVITEITTRYWASEMDKKDNHGHEPKTI